MTRIIFLLPLIFLLQATPADAVGMETATDISEPIKVDRVYKSMQGPYVRRPLPVASPDKVEILWLKKIGLELLDGKNDTPRSLNNFCHGHLVVNDERVPALFTLIQGQNAVELPGNFAVAVPSDLGRLEYVAQILNLDETEKPFDVRVKATLDYIRDSERTTEMKPLYQSALLLKIPVEPETAEMIAKGHEHCDTSLVSKDGSVEVLPTSSLTLRSDSKGNAYSIHWNVPPGKHTYSYDLQREEIKANSGATIHFATIHLHPYGTSMELVDLTANSTVFKIDVTNELASGVIEKVNHFYSEEGVPLDLDHRYRITAEYNNPTQKSVDAMAIIYMYLYDEGIEKALAPIRRPLSQKPF